MPRRPPAGRPAVRGPHRVFVDSSAWLAFFSARDGNHAASATMIGRAVDSRIALVTTNLVLAELHRLVLHRMGIHAAAAVLASMERTADVELVFPAADHHQAAKQWLEKLGDQEITYTDAVSFAVMKLEKCPAVITFDRDFVIAGFDLWHP